MAKSLQEHVNVPLALPFEPERTPSCQYIRGQRRGPFQGSNERWFGAMHLYCRNSVMNGGSLTPKSQLI
jgi:hypothetical protein